MGNAEETNELIGKTGSGNTLDSAAKDVAAVEEPFAPAERGRGRGRVASFSLVAHAPKLFWVRTERKPNWTGYFIKSCWGSFFKIPHPARGSHYVYVEKPCLFTTNYTANVESEKRGQVGRSIRQYQTIIITSSIICEYAISGINGELPHCSWDVKGETSLFDSGLCQPVTPVLHRRSTTLSAFASSSESGTSEEGTSCFSCPRPPTQPSPGSCECDDRSDWPHRTLHDHPHV